MAAVVQVESAIREAAACFEIGEMIGPTMLPDLEATDRLSECLAFFAILDS